jgi:predicted lysophospholipase L1 biosynthesis ABC-type transport system permease subunit
VVINETLARQGWPNQDPIGRRMRGGGEYSRAPWLTVVGVVRDLRRADLRREIRPELYLNTLQLRPRSQMLLIRTAGDPAAILPAVRHEVRTLNPQLPLFAVGTLADQVSETLASTRFGAVLLATFAVVALLLATIGIYGVTAHAVGQRTHEVGIRMALGARHGNVLGLMIVEHLRPAVAGVLIGAAGALALGSSLRTLVYGVGVADPLTYLAMAAALLLVTLFACWVPARRATRVDPLIALRAQ